MRVVAIVQARMGSTRLPDKMLLPLAGKPLLTNLVDRVCRAKKLDSVVVAYPLKDHESIMAALDQRTDDESYCPVGIYAAQGDENDLVQRYLHAAQAHHAELIVRIPGDNPCVEPSVIDAAVAAYLERPYTFFSNTVVHLTNRERDKYGYESVDGLGAEVLSLSRLRWLDRITVGRADWREHPHKYFEETSIDDDDNTGVQISASVGRRTLRLDVNTQADYDFIKDIYDHFGHNRFTIDEVLTYLDSKKAIPCTP